MCFKFGVALPLPMLLLCYSSILNGASSEVTEPKFKSEIGNGTVPVGREAVLTCVVTDLGSYKVAWLRVDTQTILTIQNHVITKNHRVAITYSEQNTWQLRIKDIKESDRGFYMCQINTDPMKSQMGYLDVVVPPDILDYPTSTDMVVREGSNVTLKCAATGSPLPAITWRREGGDIIALASGVDGSRIESNSETTKNPPLLSEETTASSLHRRPASVEGETLTIHKVNRLHMGAYLCIASNGVPPSVSKRIMLIVHFPPMIWVQNQLVGAVEGHRVTLECQSEAYPKSINYWTREKGEIVPQGGKFEPVLTDNAYKVVMKLSIKAVTASDYGSYKCVAKNSLGDTDGTIKLYRIPRNAVSVAEYPDARYKDKTRKPGYDTNIITEQDGESLHKRKDLPLGNHNDENYEISSTQNLHSLVVPASSLFAVLITIINRININRLFV